MNLQDDFKFLEDATEALRAIAHPIRLLIIEKLSENEVLSVTDIHESLGIEQAIASHHLRILKNQDIVVVKRSGKNAYYALSKDEYFQILKLIEGSIK